MQRSANVSDSSDWLDTPVITLAPVESSLRCQVCKDFYDTPMITSCSHTFCSLCIRRCLTNDGKCPVCRAPDQELRLRRNWTVEEVVDAFKIARPGILQMGRDLKDACGVKERNDLKRKRDFDKQAKDEVLNTQRRNTRSQSHKSNRSQQLDQVVDGEEEDNGQVELEIQAGMAACPICDKRMREEEVFSHLDVHGEGNGRLGSNQDAQLASANFQTIDLTKSTLKTRAPVKPLDRLPQLSYSLLKDTAMKKKLVDLGIPASGTRALMIRRHSEWVNLVNANCDAARPRTKRELLQDLDVWERNQGGLANNGNASSDGVNTVMNKDFDGAAWASNHGSDFQRLIAQARQKPTAPSLPDNSTSDRLINRPIKQNVGSCSQIIHDQSERMGAASKQQSQSPERHVWSSGLQTPDGRTESERGVQLSRTPNPLIDINHPS